MTVTAAPTGPQAYSEQYAAIGPAARQARDDAELILMIWHMDSLIYRVKQVVSELMANVVEQRTVKKVEMQLIRTLLGVRVSVTDSCNKLPVAQSAAPTDEDGRGLVLVGALSDDWGCDPLPVGKRVWADLHL